MSKKEGSPAGKDLVMTGCAGMAGTGLIARCLKDELRKRYSLSYWERMCRAAGHSGMKGEELVLRKEPFYALHYPGSGGIYAALWQFCFANRIGVEIELEKVPLLQETVELCEYFDINPYALDSAGCMLIAAEDGDRLAEAMERAGIPAAVIGVTTADKKKLIWRGGEAGCLERPAGEEASRLLSEFFGNRTMPESGKDGVNDQRTGGNKNG